MVLQSVAGDLPGGVTPLNSGFNDMRPVLDSSLSVSGASNPTTFAPPYPVGDFNVSNRGTQYTLSFHADDIPVQIEDTADLSVTKLCKPDVTPAIAGTPFQCTVFVDNPGPGLPRNVVLNDTMITNVNPAKASITSAQFTTSYSGQTSPQAPCTITSSTQLSCPLGTVPVGGRSTITYSVVSAEGGDFDNEATVTTDSTDPNLNNNTGTVVYRRP
jgi:hypothetical protein